jgi:endonuclease YncB( thermonuclease family)
LEWASERWRLAAIDTPERGEFLHAAARTALQRELDAGAVICLSTGERPSHGRRIGVCTVGERDVAVELVRAGYAAACHNRPKARDYAAAEREAQAAMRGIWSRRYDRKPYCPPPAR